MRPPPHGGRVQQAVAGCHVEQRSRGHEHALRQVPPGGFSGGVMSPAAMALASASTVAIAMYTRFITLCTEPRWVSWAPLGNPVVPDV